MLSLIWPLVTLSVALLLALLFLTWLLVSQGRRSSQAQLTMLQQTLSATTMTLVAHAEETRKALTETHAKSLGATTALAQQAVRGTSSVAEQLTKTTDALIPLLAAKDPIAYSQIRQTDVALSPEQAASPYPAVDDAEWQRLSKEQAEQLAKDLGLSDEQQQYLADQGVSRDALGFPDLDQQ